MLLFISEGVSDRTLIGIGLFTMMAALSWLMSTLPSFSPHTPTNLPYFVVGVAIDLAGIPTVCDVALALYSKLLPDRVQVLARLENTIVCFPSNCILMKIIRRFDDSFLN